MRFVRSALNSSVCVGSRGGAIAAGVVIRRNPEIAKPSAGSSGRASVRPVAR